MKTVLIVGDGGRESALAWSLGEHKVTIVPTDTDVVSLAKEQEADLVIIGSEIPLVNGLADQLRQKDISVFGPSKSAAQLEGSKAFAEQFMARHNIPRPNTEIITTKNLKTLQFKDPEQIVLKADGLAGGKGVVLPKTITESEEILHGMLSGSLFSGAGKNCVVIQERLHGPEVSVFALTDGTDYVILPYTQDHKRLKDNDQGPNTGGMGAYAPVPDTMVNIDQQKKIEDIVTQTINGMRAEGNEYRGVLYVGIMLAKERNGDPVVIEYNVRFGDPEAQVLLPLLKAGEVNIFSLLQSTDNALQAELYDESVINKAALTVCLAAEGYPVSPKKGTVIMGLDKKYPNVHVFYGGVDQQNGVYRTNGGRVLYLTGVGKTLDIAARQAYAAIGEKAVHFNGMQYRQDIGWQARK